MINVDVFAEWSTILMIRRLGEGDLHIIMRMQDAVYESLPNGTIFQRSTEEFILYCIRGGGACYTVECGGATVAYRMVYFPGTREFNLGKDLNLSDHALKTVAHWDTIGILPEWRGKGLASALNRRALTDLSSSQFRHLLSTSSPDNPSGLRSLFRAGFRPVRVVKKFGGYTRLLFYRPFPEEWPQWSGPSSDRRMVQLDNVAALARAFDGGWYGTSLDTGHDHTSLLMQRFDASPWALSHELM